MPDTNLVPSAATLRLEPAPDCTRLLLRGDAEALNAALALALPTAPGGVADGSSPALWLGPDEWLVLLPHGAPAPRLESDMAAVFDVSHRQRGYHLAGPAEQALALGCPLDLSPRGFPPGRCARTVFGKAEVVLWRKSGTLFHLEVWRSFAPYVRSLLGQFRPV